ncbi:MAG: hypothetical protein H0V55_04985 [Thermoleophilaceae bacterium]|jgi:hypothetical protein|nr:hypothetical protein [Thermoleophilaceae bacterium]MBA3840248.1 hypothetical protein [Thermoleophilaceae bacterium]
MPTRRPRHTITETPPVEQALRRLRSARPHERIDLKELVILGADEKAARGEGEGDPSDRRRALIEEFLHLRADDRLDATEGLALHESGWVRQA